MPRPKKPKRDTTSRDVGPAKRLMRVAGWLLRCDHPVTRDQIWEQFPDDYVGDLAAKLKKWDRDKDALREAGVPITFVDELGAYVIERDNYYLPPLAFTPAETATLWTAGQAALRLHGFPWADELVSALRKLRSADPGKHAPFAAPVTAAAEPRAEIIDTIKEASRSRKRLWMRYRSAARDEDTEREVDVHGVAWRRGSWFFVGHCHLRREPRVFDVARVRAVKLNAEHASQPDYDVPANFDIHRYVTQQEWDYWVHAPVLARVILRGELAPLAGTLLPGFEVAMDVSGIATAALEVRNLDALVRHVLALGPDAELVAPEEGRAMARSMLYRIGVP